MDFVLCSSCIGKGLSRQHAKQTCFCIMIAFVLLVLVLLHAHFQRFSDILFEDILVLSVYLYNNDQK